MQPIKMIRPFRGWGASGAYLDFAEGTTQCVAPADMAQLVGAGYAIALTDKTPLLKPTTKAKLEK